MKTPQRNAPQRARLFSEPAEPAAARDVYTANVDGGARGNPGPAAYGIVLRQPDGRILLAAGKYVGRTTNNVAEYYSLIAALDAALERGIRRLRVESDSELLVRQMQGLYRVKSPDLRPLHERAAKLARGLDLFRIEHVPREKNREADRLVNEALDNTASGGNSETRNTKMETRQQKPETMKIRARVRGGALVPAEPLGLPEGAEVELLISKIGNE
jgi:ribonuclease HI